MSVRKVSESIRIVPVYPEQNVMFESVKKLFAIEDLPSSPRSDVEKLAAAVSELEQASALAQSKAASMRADHNANLLSSLAAGDAAKRTTARKALLDIDREAEDLAAALANARNLLAAATNAAAERELADRWDRVTQLLTEREEVAARLQADLDTVAETFQTLLAITKQVTDAVPVRRADTHDAVSPGRLANDAMIYLSGRSDGKIGAQRLHLSLVEVKGLPDLTTRARGATKALLYPRHASTTAGDAA